MLIFSLGAKPCQEGVFLAYPDPPPETFGARLRRLARSKGLKNYDLEKATGAHYVTVSRWMSGKVPSGPALAVLCGLLDVDINYLLEPLGRSPQRKRTKKLEPEPQDHPVRRGKGTRKRRKA